jgi:hypothetical protein
VLVFNLYLNAQFGQPAGYFSPYFHIQTLFFKGIRAEAFPTFPGTTLANYLFGFLNGVPSTEGAGVMAATIFVDQGRGVGTPAARLRRVHDGAVVPLVGGV